MSKTIKLSTVRGVGGVIPLRQEKQTQCVLWRVERGARRNYRHLGRHLARKNPWLFRNASDGHGLIQVSANRTCRLITKASQLAPVIVDTLTMKVMKEGKVVSELPTATHLNAMLLSEAFLRRFPPVDQVAKTPLYAADFTLLRPGYHDGGDGQRLLYVGPEARISDSTETVHRFLEVMDFASKADRTNTVAAALTVLLRHRWPGEKPVVLVTATKSHSGKGTITEFIRGAVPLVRKCPEISSSASWCPKAITRSDLAAMPRLRRLAVSLGLPQKQCSGRVAVTIEDVAIFLLLLHFITDNMNEDGSLPWSRFAEFWTAVYHAGDIKRAFNPKRFKAIRDHLSSLVVDGKVLLDWEDDTYSLGRACKWRASQKLMDMMNQKRKETSFTETSLSILDDYPRPRPSWQAPREEKEQMRRLMSGIESFFENKRRLAA